MSCEFVSCLEQNFDQLSLSNEQLVYGSWGCYVNASCKSFNRTLLFCVDVCTVCDNPIMGLDTAT